MLTILIFSKPFSLTLIKIDSILFHRYSYSNPGQQSSGQGSQDFLNGIASG